jgi:hypothetical protein
MKERVVSYVVYDSETKRILFTSPTEGGVKTKLTCARKREAKRNDRVKNDRWSKPDNRFANCKVSTLEFYNANVRTTKVVRNLLSGKEVVIDVNTPACCDPSTETYWSM